MGGGEVRRVVVSDEGVLAVALSRWISVLRLGRYATTLDGTAAILPGDFLLDLPFLSDSSKHTAATVGTR